MFNAGLVAGAMVLFLGATAALAEEGEIRLIVRGDDMGVAHAANEACIKAWQQGVVRSVEVIVPGQWFLEAAKMLNENPGLDVGVHLCLTSEWEVCKWRPLTNGKSISDENGYFYPMTRRPANWPPNTGFLDANPKLDEVEAELRAQIEMARKHIKNVSHLSLHMGTPAATPEMRKLCERLAGEYKLPLECPAARYLPGFGRDAKTGEQKAAALAAMIEKLTPGLYVFVDHPGMDTPEMQAMGHKGYEQVAADRAGVTHAFTSESVKKAIAARQVKLISYAQAQER